MTALTPSDWLDALELEFEGLAGGMLGLGRTERVGRTSGPPPGMEGAYLALLSDAGPYQIGVASSPEGCRVLANGLLSVEEGAPALPPADVADAVCEIANMLGGCVARRLRERAGLQASLGLPTFFHGPVQVTERLGVASAEVRVRGVSAAVLVLHPRARAHQET